VTRERERERKREKEREREGDLCEESEDQEFKGVIKVRYKGVSSPFEILARR
jgi:hypothetical protein